MLPEDPNLLLLKRHPPIRFRLPTLLISAIGDGAIGDGSLWHLASVRASAPLLNWQVTRNLLYLQYLIPEGVPLGFGVGLGCPLVVCRYHLFNQLIKCLNHEKRRDSGSIQEL